MTVVRRVGQRFMVGFEGLAASADVKALLREFGVGGVVLFSRNVADPEQVVELVRELQTIARDAGHETPLLVAVDQEGGRVARLREPWTVWPAARAVGRLGSEETARQMGAALAEELSACGVRYDFAPCVDVDTNPKNPVIGDRSFGDDPDLVGRLGAAMIRGLQENGVAACA
jgi:beta-N-acetylhexosaminidase